MKLKQTSSLLWLLWSFIVLQSPLYAQTPDNRDISQGFSIYENGYINQPYVNGPAKWKLAVCIYHGNRKKSTSGQHVVAATSTDQGRCWSPTVDIEPNTGPLASWAMQYLTPYGRLYALYYYNGDNINSLNGKPLRTAGELGWYCYKYMERYAMEEPLVNMAEADSTLSLRTSMGPEKRNWHPVYTTVQRIETV